jgi:hypothetical protein
MRRGSGKVVAGSPLGPFCFHSTEARTKRSVLDIMSSTEHILESCY